MTRPAEMIERKRNGGTHDPAELMDADHGAAESELASLAAAGRVTREPLGQDALWRLAAAHPAAA